MSDLTAPHVISSVRLMTGELEPWARVAVAARAVARAAPLVLPPMLPGGTIAEDHPLGFRSSVRLAARRSVARALVSLEHRHRPDDAPRMDDLIKHAVALGDRAAEHLASAAAALLTAAHAWHAGEHFGADPQVTIDAAARAIEHAWWALRLASVPDQMFLDALRVDLVIGRPPAPNAPPPRPGLDRFGPLWPGRGSMPKSIAPTTAT